MAKVVKTVFKSELEFEYVKEALDGNKHYLVTDKRSYCYNEPEKYGKGVNRGRLIEMMLRLYANEPIDKYEQDGHVICADSKKFGNIKSANASVCYDVDGIVPTLENWDTLLGEYMRRYAKMFTFATFDNESRIVTAWTFYNPEDATKWIIEYMGRYTTDSRESTKKGKAKIGLKPETKKAIKALNEMAEA